MRLLRIISSDGSRPNALGPIRPIFWREAIKKRVYGIGIHSLAGHFSICLKVNRIYRLSPYGVRKTTDLGVFRVISSDR